MPILNAEQRANLREFFDHDKTNVFEVFMKAVRQKLMEQSALGPDQWTTNMLTIAKETKIGFVNELLQLLENEMADQEVDDA